MTLPRTLLAASLAAVTFLGVSCNKEKSPATGAAASATRSGDLSPDTVVAKVNNENITLAQVDEEAKPELQQLDKQRFDIRKQHLNGLITQKMVKAEAASRGMTDEQLIKAEVDDKVTPPSDEEIQKVFDSAKAQLPPGSTLDKFKPQIAEYLTRQKKQELAGEFLASLRKKNNVEIKFSQPRVEVAAKGPSKGPDDAKVTIVEFSDFQCPFCSRAHDTLDQVMNAYAGKVKFVYRQFPLNIHPNAEKAAEASLCANDQGQFWKMYDTLFANQRALEEPKLSEYAKQVGLDQAKFEECLKSGKFAQAVKDDQAAGEKLGVNGTPAIFINGIPFNGAVPFDELKETIDSELATKS